MIICLCHRWRCYPREMSLGITSLKYYITHGLSREVRVTCSQSRNERSRNWNKWKRKMKPLLVKTDFGLKKPFKESVISQKTTTISARDQPVKPTSPYQPQSEKPNPSTLFPKTSPITSNPDHPPDHLINVTPPTSSTNPAPPRTTISPP